MLVHILYLFCIASQQGHEKIHRYLQVVTIGRYIKLDG